MIYEFPPANEVIVQGDIFSGIPRIDLSLSDMLVVEPTGQIATKLDWNDIANRREPATVVVPVRPVNAIVISQDCDAARSPDITLCEIRDFREVERNAKETKSPTKWVAILTQHSRLNQKWFYLPPYSKIGFTDKQAADFLVTIRVPRADLEARRNLRRGRLNSTAREHFRERIGEFFRRYPFDEWYALSPEELEAYSQKHPGTEPYPWQK